MKTLWKDKITGNIAHVKQGVLQVGSTIQDVDTNDVYDGVGLNLNADNTVTLIAYYEGVYLTVDNVPRDLLVKYLNHELPPEECDHDWVESNHSVTDSVEGPYTPRICRWCGKIEHYKFVELPDEYQLLVEKFKETNRVLNSKIPDWDDCKSGTNYSQ